MGPGRRQDIERGPAEGDGTHGDSGRDQQSGTGSRQPLDGTGQVADQPRHDPLGIHAGGNTFRMQQGLEPAAEVFGPPLPGTRIPV